MKPLTTLNDLRDFDYRGFLRWWGAELAFLLPASLRLWWGRRSNRVVLRADDAVLDVHLRSSAGARLLRRWTKDEDQDAALGALIAAEAEAEGAENVLLLAGSAILRRSIVLPAAALENLVQVVGFELDRYTPFKESQLYYDARAKEPLADGARVRVEFAAVSRTYLDALLARLAVAGVRPDSVDVENPGQALSQGGFNLSPERYRPRRSGLPLRLTQALAGLLCLLLAAVGAVPVVMDDRFIEQLREEVRRATKAAKVVEAMREETEGLGKAAAFVLDKKLGQPPLVVVLADLTARLPDDGWLSALQMREGHIEMQGQVKTASALIALLEDSPYLRNTTFLAPVTPEPTSKMERFRIGADIVGVAPQGGEFGVDAASATDHGEDAGHDAE